jgi:hypothetical protein
MSRRQAIATAIADRIKDVKKSNGYKTDLFEAVEAKLKYWDEVNDFPSVYVTAGGETRDYLPGQFKWGFLTLSIKAYTKSDLAVEELEDLLEDIEKVLDSNAQLIYDSVRNEFCTDINIISINTDEGLLLPYGVGEIIIQVRYQVM